MAAGLTVIPLLSKEVLFFTFHTPHRYVGHEQWCSQVFGALGRVIIDDHREQDMWILKISQEFIEFKNCRVQKIIPSPLPISDINFASPWFVPPGAAAPLAPSSYAPGHEQQIIYCPTWMWTKDYLLHIHKQYFVPSWYCKYLFFSIFNALNISIISLLKQAQ